MDPSELQRLKGWLDAARRAQDAAAPDAERSAAGPSGADGVLDFVDRQRRSRHVRALAEVIRKAPLERLRTKRGRWIALSSAAAAIFAVGIGTAALTNWPAAGPVANAINTDGSAGAAAHANLRQVVGKVIATHAGGENRVVGADTPVVPGDELSTAAEAFASLEAGKARIDLSAATTLRLTELDASTQVIHLQAGRVDVSVPRVPGEQRLVRVTTADATVTVHGTVFSVETRVDETGPVTTVGVTRGLVSVERTGGDKAGRVSADEAAVMLHPGESWSSRNGRLASAVAPAKNPAKLTSDDGAAADVASVDRSQNRAGERRRKGRLGRGAETSSASRRAEAAQSSDALEPRRGIESRGSDDKSDLAEQNRIFESAMRARDRGDDGEAIQQLRHLLSAHPDSPLKSTAQAELSKASRRLGQR